MTALSTITDLDEMKDLAGTDLGRTDWLEITREQVKLRQSTAPSR